MSDARTVPPRRLYRDPAHRVIGGVAAGVAGHLRVPTMAVRIAFVLLLGVNGLGVLLYAAFWAVLPTAPALVSAGTDPTARPATRDRRQLLPFVLLGAGIVLTQSLIGVGGANLAIGWLVAMIAVGAGIIWHLSDAQLRRRWTRQVPQAPWLGVVFDNTDRRSYLLRLIGGGACVIVGVIGLLVVVSPLFKVGLVASAEGVLFAFLGLGGVALVTAPLLWRTFGQLRAEREARIREQERAEVAAIVHDQVLHTLALIQRNAADPRTVQRLARVQERSLRGWLYRPSGSPGEMFAAAIEHACAEIEGAYAIAVESVVVGDCAVDENVAALVAAAREAVVNAARHAKVETVSVYAEVESDTVSVFVRDRGVGFDPDQVEPDRQGVRGSIVGRMARHGGTAEIRSEPGEGTEVRLRLPLTAGDPS